MNGYSKFLVILLMSLNFIAFGVIETKSTPVEKFVPFPKRKPVKKLIVHKFFKQKIKIRTTRRQREEMENKVAVRVLYMNYLDRKQDKQVEIGCLSKEECCIL